MDCVICYKTRLNQKNGITCSSGHHTHCGDCIEKGKLAEVSSSGWPAYRIRCAVCRTYSYHVIDKIENLALARALIADYQEKLREDDD